jgi:hypothetical protein
MDEELVRRVYGAYNARNLKAAMLLTQGSVRWGHGKDGGFVTGHAGLRELWTRQWSNDPTLLEPQRFSETEEGTVVVEVVRRKRKGQLLQESAQLHRFIVTEGLIEAMELRAG